MKQNGRPQCHGVLWLSLLLALLLALSCGAAWADTVASGACGTNVTWTLDDQGTLTISGSGNMYS